MVGAVRIPDGIHHHEFSIGKEKIGLALDDSRIRRPSSDYAFRLIFHPGITALLDFRFDRLFARTDLQRACNMEELAEKAGLLPLSLNGHDIGSDQIVAVSTKPPGWSWMRQPSLQISIYFR